MFFKKLTHACRQITRPKDEHGNYKYKCPNCNEWITARELDASWGPSGPSCPFCHAGGMGFFVSVTEQDHPNGIIGGKR